MAEATIVIYSKKDMMKRVLWNIMWTIFIRPFPRQSARKLEIRLLRMFGADISSDAVIYSSAKIIVPWNLKMEAHSCIADGVYVENSTMVHLKKHAIVSQQTYLCTGSHDTTTKKFTAQSKPITIGERAWVSAKCFIGPGVRIGDGAVVSAASVVFKNVKPWTIVWGNPAVIIGDRVIEDL